MWEGAEDWKGRKEQHERYESRGQSSIEGITQSLVVSFIIVQKYVEENEDYGYQLQHDVYGRDSFGGLVHHGTLRHRARMWRTP